MNKFDIKIKLTSEHYVTVLAKDESHARALAEFATLQNVINASPSIIPSRDSEIMIVEVIKSNDILEPGAIFINGKWIEADGQVE